MITAYYRQQNRIESVVLTPSEALPQGTLWVDMLAPNLAEEASVSRSFGITLPDQEENWKNDVLNRMYKENGVSYMTAAIITQIDTPYPQTSAVTFILTSEALITLRRIDPTSFHQFAQRITQHPDCFTNGAEMLEGLLEEIIMRVAHNSEVVTSRLDTISHQIFDRYNNEQRREQNLSAAMKNVLRELGACVDLNSKINESLHSLSRLLYFFKDTQVHSSEVETGLAVLQTDVSVLTQQTSYLADKITFQLDATLGMINVEQNIIIKIFSVVAVFFLPPTLVSSIYGMNFRHMPELDWMAGYPIAITLMLLCALIPFVYFRRRGWL